MRTTLALLGGIVASAAFAASALPAPNGLAPFPGRYNPYAAPPPPNPSAAPSAYGGSADAPPSPPAAQPLKPAGCVWSRHIRDWSPVDDRTMIVRQGSKRFLVTFSGSCRDSRYEYGMGVDTRYSSCLRAGDRVTFGSPWGHRRDPMAMPCYIKKVEELPRQAQR